MIPKEIEWNKFNVHLHADLQFGIRNLVKISGLTQFIYSADFTNKKTYCNDFKAKRLQKADNGLVQLTQATPLDYQTQGQIRIIAAGLETGHLITDNGQIIYFAREKVTQQTHHQWENFCAAQKRCQQKILELLTDYMDAYGQANIYDHYNNRGYFKYSNKLEILKNFVDYNELSIESAFKLTEQLTALEDGLKFFDIKLKTYEEKYVLYASSKPVTTCLINLHEDLSLPLISFKDYQDKFGHILMVTTATKSLQCTEHRGTFKLPLACISQVKANLKSHQIFYGGLSIALHLFGMKCVKRNGSEFMTISLLPSMHQILKHAMNQDFENGNIIEGVTNILAAGWQSQIRSVSDLEKPIVCHLKKATIKLWK